MNSALSWSIKGIDPETREAAKIAARKSGMTLGQWLNSKIIATADEVGEAAPLPQPPARGSRDWRAPDAFDDRVDYLEERLAALTRIQSDTALNRGYAAARPGGRDDEALQIVLERLSRNETETLRSVDSLHNRLDQIAEVVTQPHGHEERQRASRPSGDPRYETLEKALESVVSHIEHSDTSVRDTLQELHARLSELGSEGQRGADQATRRILGEIEQQLTALGHRVDRISDKAPTSLATDIESRLSKLSQRLESTEQHTSATVSELRHDVEERIGGLADRLDRVADQSRDAVSDAVQAARASTGDVLRDVEEQLRDLASRVHAASGSDDATRHAISELREEVSGLSADIDLIKHHAASEHDLQALRDMLGGLAETVEAQASSTTHEAAFETFERRLSEMSQRLNASLEQPAVDPNMEVLERKVHEIDARLAAGQDDGQREQIMFAVEQQVSGLVQRLDAAEQRYTGIQAIEKSIAQLFETVEQTRTWAGEAAQRTASQMAEKLQKQVAQQIQALTPGETASPDAIKAIETGLAAVKASSASTDQRTQETLEAVHDTLERVVTRLIALETQARQAPATAEPAPRPASGARPPAGDTERYYDDDDIETDEEPATKSDWRAAIDAKSAMEMEEILAGAPLGETPAMHLSAPAGQPRPNASRAPAAPAMPEPHGGPTLEAAPGPGASGEPQDQVVNRRNDFIAAARRAAQAASQEPQADAGRSRFSLLRRAKKQAAETPDAGDEDSGRKRRPLILAAIVLLLIGAVSAYSFLGAKRNADVSALSLPPVSGTAPATGGEPQMLELPPQTPQTAAQEPPEMPPLEQADPRSDRAVLPPGPGTPNAGSIMDMQPLDMDRPNQTTVAQTPDEPVVTGSIAPEAASGHNQTLVAMDPLLDDGRFEGFAITPSEPQRADQVVAPSQPAPAATVPSAELPPEGTGTLELRTAAAQGDPTAQFLIASRLTDGEGVAQDYRQAALWYQRAAAQGLAPAQYRLGTFYEKGRGVPQDLAAARIWYERAAEKGNRKAMHNLAVIHADGSRGEPNFAKAALWFRNAAELGLRDSQYNLAILHERGLGVEENPRQAYRWFALAARQGDVDAQARLGIIEARLSAQDLVEVKAEVETWQPQQAIQEANVVSPPSQGWVSDAARTPSSPLLDATTRELVLEAQTLLNTLGYDAGAPDGLIGERTRTAIRTFEGANGLAATGSVTPGLIETLRNQAGA
jgi:localization factor PodJL